MGPPFSRRQFLVSLSALGATLTFPALASATQVNRSWAELLRSPWYFEIDEYGTIVEPEGKQPSIRRDVYDFEVGFINSQQDLIDEIQSHEELRSHFYAAWLPIIETSLSTKSSGMKTWRSG
jgi:hypothetical protein